MWPKFHYFCNMNKNYSLENLSEVAAELISAVKNKTLLFYGQMGVGGVNSWHTTALPEYTLTASEYEYSFTLQGVNIN